MSDRDFVRSLPTGEGLRGSKRLVRIHLDPLLLITLMVLIGYGLVMLYSALDKNTAVFATQLSRMGLALVALLIAAQLPPRFYLRWSPLIYLLGLLLLGAVLIFGVTVKGSRRWLELPGFARFQPAELMKIAVPMMVAWYFNDQALPPRLKHLLYALVIIAAPAALISIQPDLGTALLVAAAGLSVVLFSGIYWRWIGYAVLSAAVVAPGLWMVMKDYQQQRVLTLFDPQSDPLGTGWNIIQSKIAIGSGGIFGKGLFEGTQSHLEFLPESQTDFIIAVIGEELGLLGLCVLLLLYLLIIARGLYIATAAQNTYSRLLAAALTLTFFVYVFVNIAMVSGLLPIVGVPLPLVSYGGTSAITLLASFGIVMSIQTHRGW